jgi:sulfur-oxidizing protein SoxY
MRHKQMGRREGLALAMGLVGLSVLPRRASAQLAGPTRAAVERVLAGRTPEEAGVTLRLPPIAENGNTVPMTVIVDSPMTEADHIKAIHVFADRNPTPEVATFRLSPAMGRAQVDTRIRLGQTQDVIAIAETSGGRLLIGQAEVKVTIGGCGG